MSFETDDARSSLSRIGRKIRTRDFGTGLITWKGAALGFTVGVVALVVILCFRPLGPFRADGMLFAIPIITAVALPLLYSTTRGIISRLSSPPRRPRAPDDSLRQDDPPDAGQPKVPYEWTDQDFIPPHEPDPIKELRQEVRQRLADGATQREVEDLLVARGLDAGYVTTVVSSVRNSGRRTLPTEPAAEFRFDDPGGPSK